MVALVPGSVGWSVVVGRTARVTIGGGCSTAARCCRTSRYRWARARTHSAPAMVPQWIAPTSPASGAVRAPRCRAGQWGAVHPGPGRDRPDQEVAAARAAGWRLCVGLFSPPTRFRRPAPVRDLLADLRAAVAWRRGRAVPARRDGLDDRAPLPAAHPGWIWTSSPAYRTLWPEGGVAAGSSGWSGLRQEADWRRGDHRPPRCCGWVGRVSRRASPTSRPGRAESMSRRPSCSIGSRPGSS